MSLEAVCGDSNAKKGIVICCSLHWYRYSGKTGQQRAAQHLIWAQQSLNTLPKQHGWQILPGEGPHEFSDNFFLGMTHEFYNSMRKQTNKHFWSSHNVQFLFWVQSSVILKLNLINTAYFPKESVHIMRKKNNCPSISRHTLSSSPYSCEDQLDGLKHKQPHTLTDIDPSL